MKATIVAPLLLAGLTAGAPLEKRQGLIDSMLKLLPASYSVAPANVQIVKGKLRADTQRKVIRYGPFNLPPMKAETKPADGHAHSGGGSMEQKKPSLMETLSLLSAQQSMDPNGFSMMKMLQKGAICTDCTVFAGKMQVVLADGKQAKIGDGVYLHHAITVDLSKSIGGFVTACPSNVTMMGQPLKSAGAGGINTFIGGAVDDFTQFYTTRDAKFPSGYYIKDNNFMMQAEIINYKKEPQNVFIELDLEYVPGKFGSDAEQGVLTAVGCDGKNLIWKPEKNTKGVVATDGYEVYRDGHIVLARGHMHDGGTGMNMYVNGKLYCESKAIYGGEGGTVTVDGKSWSTIGTMTECNDPIPVKKGDKIKLEATFDTKEHPLRESHGVEQENMGIMTMVFAPSVNPA